MSLTTCNIWSLVVKSLSHRRGVTHQNSRHEYHRSLIAVDGDNQRRGNESLTNMQSCIVNATRSSSVTPCLSIIDTICIFQSLCSLLGYQQRLIGVYAMEEFLLQTVYFANLVRCALFLQSKLAAFGWFHEWGHDQQDQREHSPQQ